VVTINADRPVFRAHIEDRAAKRVDWAAAERAEKAESERAAAERREHLYFRLFGSVRGNRLVEALRSEAEARELFKKAILNADVDLQIQILRVAVDNRWHAVVTAFIKQWTDEHGIAATVEELWSLILTTGRAAV
jgi:hypothetical protein